MPPPSRRTLLSAFAVALVAMLPVAAPAQEQERGLVASMRTGDRTLTSSFTGKRFGGGDGGSGLGGKTAATRPFLFGKRAELKSYRAKDFTGARGFQSNTFAGRDRVAAVNTPAAGLDRAFSTRDVNVREARDARKALPVRAARTAAFAGVGKRQDALDEQQRARPMTIDDVRDLLNKSR